MKKKKKKSVHRTGPRLVIIKSPRKKLIALSAGYEWMIKVC